MIILIKYENIYVINEEDIEDEIPSNKRNQPCNTFTSSELNKIYKKEILLPLLEQKKYEMKYTNPSMKKLDEQQLLSSLSFENIWNRLMDISISFTTKIKDPKERKNIKRECALKNFSQYLQSDLVGNILYSKNNPDIPLGFNCSLSFPFDEKCKNKEINNDPSKQFIKWVILLNNNKLQFAYSKDQIKKDSPHYKLQQAHNFNFVLPDTPKEQKKFIENMNQIAAQLLLLQLQSRTKTHIKKLSESQVESEKLKKYMDSSASDEERPFIFFVPELKNTVILPLSPSSAIPFTYLIKKYTKSHINKVLKSNQFTDEEKKIVSNFNIYQNKKLIDDITEKNYISQMNSFGDSIKNMVKEVINENNLCKKEKDNINIMFKSFAENKINTNHIHFNILACIKSIPWGINVTPLFNGWVSSYSINKKLFSIDTISKFFDEYNEKKQNKIMENIKEPMKKNIQILSMYADNTPLILSVSTGIPFLKFSLFDDKSVKTTEYPFLSSDISTKIVSDSPSLDTSTKPIKLSTLFHKCAETKFLEEIKKMEKLNINNVHIFPIAIKTKVETQDKNTTIKPMFGIKTVFGILPKTGVMNFDILKFLNSKNNNLQEFKEIIKNEYLLHDTIFNDCIPKQKLIQ